VELQGKSQNLQCKCYPFEHSVQAFQRSLLIVKLQVIRRKDTDPKSGEDMEEIMYLLCHGFICLSEGEGKNSFIRVRFFSLFCTFVFFFLVLFWG